MDAVDSVVRGNADSMATMSTSSSMALGANRQLAKGPSDELLL